MTDERSSGREPTWRTWLLAMAIGVVAGVGSWLVGEGVLQAYRPALMPAMKPIPTQEDSRLVFEARVASGTMALAAMGGLFGLAGGLAGGGSRRSVGRAAGAGGAGLLLGAAGVACVARLILPLIYRDLDPQSSDLIMPLLGHEAVWSVAGGLGGLAFGFGAGGPVSPWRTGLAGLLGAALATVVYEFVGALGFPTHRTHLPLAGSPETRAMAQILVAIGTASGAVMATANLKTKPPSP